MIGAALLLGQVAQQAPAAPAPLDRKNYIAMRAEAQKIANETGFDYGMSKDYFVVMCEILAQCRTGHGPCAY
jgi:hypothetical protein